MHNIYGAHNRHHRHNHMRNSYAWHLLFVEYHIQILPILYANALKSTNEMSEGPVPRSFG